jgi:DNA-binding PadR family transcriptional regulator
MSEALTPAVFQVLLSLAEGDKHGYAVLKDVAEQSGGEVTLSTGTLYAVFKRLLSDGLIAECRHRPPVDEDDQRRRYYRITPAGRAVAVAEAQRMERLLEQAREARLIGKPRPA